MLPGRNVLNLAMVLASAGLLVWFLGTGSVLPLPCHAVV